MADSAPAPRLNRVAPRRAAWLLVLPLAFFCLSLYLQKINGPYYLCNNSDPDYVYLYSSLNLANGVAPRHTDHPGTTLQVWGAVVLRGVHLVAGRGTLAADVAAQPEFYLRAISDTLLVASAVGLYFLGRAARRVFGRGDYALLAQATGLIFPVTIQYWPRVNPEAATLIICQWLAVEWLGLAYGSPSVAKGRRAALVLGALAGAAMATKLTFAPLLLAGMAQFAGWRARGQFLAAAAGSFVLFTLPIASHWIATASWLLQMASHQGAYGSGAAGWPGLMTYLRSIRWFMETYPVYPVLAGWTLGVVAWFWLIGRRQELDPALRQLGRTLTALLIFHVALLLLMAKQPAARYMFPSLGLMAVTVLIAADFIWRARLRLACPKIALVARAVAVVFIAWQAVVSVPQQCLGLAATAAHQTEMAEIADALSAKYLVVHCTWSSSPGYAEWLADNTASQRYSAELARRFPDYVGLDLGAKQYVRFGGVLADEDSAAADALLHSRAGVLFQLGLPVYLQYNPVTLPKGYRLVPLYGMPDESLYWLGRDGAEEEWRQVQKDLRAALAERAAPG